MGYHLSGFDVEGVDLSPQGNYPFKFHQADAMTFNLDDYDIIHASPPCQAFTKAKAIHGVGAHVDLLTPMRQILNNSGKPWIIENVPGSPMRADITLCGSMFQLCDPGVGYLRRHRHFEFGNLPGLQVPLLTCNHKKPTISVFGHGGHVYHGVDSWRRVMDIDWMTRNELAQAIPPAYTEYLGTQLRQSINVGN